MGNSISLKNTLDVPLYYYDTATGKWSDPIPVNSSANISIYSGNHINLSTTSANYGTNWVNSGNYYVDKGQLVIGSSYVVIDSPVTPGKYDISTVTTSKPPTKLTLTINLVNNESIPIYYYNTSSELLGSGNPKWYTLNASATASIQIYKTQHINLSTKNGYYGTSFVNSGNYYPSKGQLVDGATYTLMNSTTNSNLFDLTLWTSPNVPPPPDNLTAKNTVTTTPAPTTPVPTTRPAVTTTPAPTTRPVVTTTPQGTTITTAPVGSTVTTTPQGNIVTTAPNGSIVTTAPAGSTIEKTSNGSIVTTAPNGSVTIAPPPQKSNTPMIIIAVVFLLLLLLGLGFFVLKKKPATTLSKFGRDLKSINKF